MKKALAFMVIVLLAGTTYGTIGDIWDVAPTLSTDNNPTHANPNGVWSYMSAIPAQTLLVWEASYIEGHGAFYYPAQNWQGLFSFEPGYPNPTSWLLEPNDFGGHCPWIVRWTSPVAGWVKITGQVWQRSWDTGKRLMQWQLRKNGVQFNHGYEPQDPGTLNALMGRDNAGDFRNGVGGPNGIYAEVVVGDLIELYTDGTPTAEWPLGPAEFAEPYGTYIGASFILEQVDPNSIPKATLTVVTNPPAVNTVAPAPGVHLLAIGNIPLVASPYVNCPTVMKFDHWVGAGIANPAAASTTVALSINATVTAFYVDNRACGDVCHPISPVDLNNDCAIDLIDFQMIAGAWLQCTKPSCDP